MYPWYSKYLRSKQFNIFRIFYIFNIIGATVSCLALSFATIILLLLRKIRSTRNYIHCNLFLSIIISTIFKTILFIQGHGWIDNIDICAITFLTVYGTILQMTWTLFEGSKKRFKHKLVYINLTSGVHLHLLLSLSYLPKHTYYLPVMITAGWAYPLMLVMGHLIHVSCFALCLVNS